MSDADEELSPEDQKALEELTKAIASELAEGKSQDSIAKELVKNNWPETKAKEFVAHIANALEQYKQSPEGRSQLASAYAKHMIYGFLWAAGGIIVTAVSYSAVAESGGTYVVAWGAVVFGAIEFLIGLVGYIKNC